MSAGKGDKPRNCFSKEYRQNYDEIDWGNKEDPTEKEKRIDKALNDILEIVKELGE